VVALAVDAANLYWAEDGVSALGRILSVPLSGGTITTLAINQNDPLGIVVDDRSVYWANVDSIRSLLK
jgi:hypothetical protein